MGVDPNPRLQDQIGIADTGVGEALGAGEGLRDAGESAARVLLRGLWGLKRVSCSIRAVVGQRRYFGRAPRRCLQRDRRPLHHRDCNVDDDRCRAEGWPGLGWRTEDDGVLGRLSGRRRCGDQGAERGSSYRATVFQPNGWRRRYVDSGTE